MRISLTTILLLTILTTGSYAQKFRISLSNKHLKKVEKITAPAKKLKKYRKLHSKDSAKFIKKRDKLYTRKKDSLDKAFKQYAKTGIMDTLALPQEYRNHLTPNLLDSGAMASQGKSLFKSAGSKWMQENSEYKEYQQALNKNPELAKWMKKYGNDPEALGQMPDSIFNGSYIDDRITQRAGSLKEFQQFNKETGQFDKLMNLPGSYQSQKEGYLKEANQYTDLDKLEQLGKDKAKIEAAKYAADFLSKNSEMLGGLQKDLAKLKKKYSSFQSNGDLTKAVKRNSLKGRPLGERIVLGGNFEIHIGEPIKIDISPLVGFRFNKKFTAGLGGTYRMDFVKDSTINSQFDKQVYGVNAFMSYDVIKRFFLYAQLDYLTKNSKNTQPEKPGKAWEPSVVAGVGRAFKVAPKITGTVILLYTILESEVKNPAGNKWQVKFGFQTNELSFKKIKKSF